MSETAGSLLRRARTAQGLHIAALAASLKVPPRKLELLETDRYDELPDAAFVRALAITLCRALKIEAGPVLALLPRSASDTGGLDHVAAGLNEPFRERPDRHVPSDWSGLAMPGLWGTGLLLVAAAAVYLWPELRGAGEWVRESVKTMPALFSEKPVSGLSTDVAAPAAGPMLSASMAAKSPEGATTAAQGPGSAAVITEPAVVSTSASTTVPEPAAGAQLVAGSGVLHLSASSSSWIEVFDGRGRPLLSRTLQPGEDVALDGAPPFKLTVGNAAATRLRFHGEAIDLVARARNNVARIELK